MIDHLGIAIEAASVAGDVILESRRNWRGVSRLKGDGSPVTEADMRADQVIRQVLERCGQAVPIVSEESDLSDREMTRLLRSSPCSWLIDPLDGTRDFVAGTDEFTVNVALIRYGHCELGVVLAPARGLLYFAERGKGSFRRRLKEGQDQMTQARRFSPDNLHGLISRQHSRGEDASLLQLFPSCQVSSCGSALKYALIAEGTYDFALRYTPTSVWDTAAAQCVLEEAGGAMWIAGGQNMEIWGDSILNPPFLAVGDAHLDPHWREALLKLLP